MLVRLGEYICCSLKLHISKGKKYGSKLVKSISLKYFCHFSETIATAQKLGHPIWAVAEIILTFFNQLPKKNFKEDFIVISDKMFKKEEKLSFSKNVEGGQSIPKTVCVQQKTRNRQKIVLL